LNSFETNLVKKHYNISNSLKHSLGSIIKAKSTLIKLFNQYPNPIT
jgi:hypothetical protein